MSRSCEIREAKVLKASDGTFRLETTDTRVGYEEFTSIEEMRLKVDIRNIAATLRWITGVMGLGVGLGIVVIEPIKPVLGGKFNVKNLFMGLGVVYTSWGMAARAGDKMTVVDAQTEALKRFIQPPVKLRP